MKNIKRSVLFLLPFGKGMGVGHLTRQSVLGRALRAKGYETILWSNGRISDIPAIFKDDMEEGFTRILEPSAIMENALRFPSAPAAADLAEIENLVAVIMDDYRGLNDKDTAIWAARRKSLTAIVAQTHKQGAIFAMVDGVPNLEFDLPDFIINLELGYDEKLYKPGWLKRMLWSGEHKYALMRPAFFNPEPIAEQIPDNAFAVMIGGTDPKNAAQSILEGMIGTPYNPVLVAGKSSKTEDQAKQQKWQETLAEFPQSAWVGGLNSGQMHTLWNKVKLTFLGPGATPSRELLFARCPFVGVFSNPSLEEQVKALEKMGIPTLRAQNHAEFMASWGDEKSPVTAKFGKDDIQKAVRRLEELGYIKNRLPDAPPFNQVDEHGAERLVKALGL